MNNQIRIKYHLLRHILCFSKWPGCERIKKEHRVHCRHICRIIECDGVSDVATGLGSRVIGQILVNMLARAVASDFENPCVRVSFGDFHLIVRTVKPKDSARPYRRVTFEGARLWSEDVLDEEIRRVLADAEALYVESQTQNPS